MSVATAPAPEPAGKDDVGDFIMPIGSAKAPEAHSTISFCDKVIVVTSGFAANCLVGALIAQESIYISLFDSNPTIVGVFTTIAILYTVWVGPLIGRLADEGRFNILCFRDRQFWGRRAPVTFLSIPIGMVSFFTTFVGAESMGEIGAALWFGLVNLLAATAFGGYNAASNSAISELFPTDSERVKILMGRGAAQSIGNLVGAAGIASLALSQDDKGSDEQRTLFLILGCVTAFLWLLLLPWAYVMRRTVAKKEVQHQRSLFAACKECFVAVPMFRMLSLGEHLVGAASSLFTLALPFFFRDVLEFKTNEVSAATAVLIGVIALCGIAGAPLVGLLTRCFLPARVLGTISVTAGVLVPIALSCGYAMREDVLQSVLVMTVLAGPVIGMALAAAMLVRVVLITKIVDLDHVNRAKEVGCLLADGSATVSDVAAIPARRDGLFQSIFGSMGFLGAAWSGLFPIALDVFGYESSRNDENPPQPQEDAVRLFIHMTISALIPIIFFVYAWIMFRFPLHGEWLALLSKEYSSLFVGMKKAVESVTDSTDTSNSKQPLDKPRHLEEKEEESDAQVAVVVADVDDAAIGR